MSWTALIFIALIVRMLWMHTRPVGHDGCGSHRRHTSSSTRAERDGS